VKDSEGHIGSVPAEQAGEASIPVAVRQAELPSDAANLIISLLPCELGWQERSRKRELRRPRWRRPRM